MIFGLLMIVELSLQCNFRTLSHPFKETSVTVIPLNLRPQFGLHRFICSENFM